MKTHGVGDAMDMGIYREDERGLAMLTRSHLPRVVLHGTGYTESGCSLTGYGSHAVLVCGRLEWRTRVDTDDRGGFHWLF